MRQRRKLSQPLRWLYTVLVGLVILWLLLRHDDGPWRRVLPMRVLLAGLFAGWIAYSIWWEYRNDHERK